MGQSLASKELFAINFRYHRHDPRKVDFILACFSKTQEVDGVRVVAINRLWEWVDGQTDIVSSDRSRTPVEIDSFRTLLWTGGIAVSALRDTATEAPLASNLAPLGDDLRGEQFTSTTRRKRVMTRHGMLASVMLAVALGAWRSRDGVLAATADMHAARAAHTATALEDGRVLIVGGFTQLRSPASAEVYEPSTRRFLPVSPPRTARHSHSATRLADGKVLIAGGLGDGTSTLASAELFDPASNTFTPTGSLRTARSGHVAVLLKDGKVLIMGGVGPNWSFLATAELYDPGTGQFTPTGEMSVPRESHIAVRMVDGSVLVVGGHRGRREAIAVYASAEIYQPAAGTFSKVGDMHVRRHKHDAVVLADGSVLVTGGADERDERGVYHSSEVFMPTTRTFVMAPAMQMGRYKHAGTSVLLSNGAVLVGGGAPQAELYEPSLGRFTVVAGEPRMGGQFAAVAALPAGGALITGGYGNGSGPRASAWVYRP